uniref:Dephospho-CoA kinase n=1 Tax=Candidatus Kentrum sp. LPFa TaxID=2126335 RepID=A0A450VSI5_9GAMM|nr:MAG: dephospho-CoA kinase [Candidatus Kentron sp. LPFa]VFK28668.1 MAG: dephospho-CoA kinase [Candidatus Kentron sp. LPFa]
MNDSRFTIALTGGIAAGKSAVTRILAEQGVAIIDADAAAREIVEPGQPALAELVSIFGRHILDAQGGLDRAAVRARVFADPSERKRIEGILHPRIEAEMWRRAKVAAGPYCVLAIPLLLESGGRVAASNDAADRGAREEARRACKDAWRVARVLVVDAPVARQFARARERDGSKPETIRGIIAAQASREERLAVADDVIRNDGDWEHLERQTMDLHHRYLEIARYHTRP